MDKYMEIECPCCFETLKMDVEVQKEISFHEWTCEHCGNNIFPFKNVQHSLDTTVEHLGNEFVNEWGYEEFPIDEFEEGGY